MFIPLTASALATWLFKILVLRIKLSLPPDYIVRRGTTKAGKFFGIDKIQIISDGGVDLGTYDVGYSDSAKALEESKRFNSNLAKYLTSPL